MSSGMLDTVFCFIIQGVLKAATLRLQGNATLLITHSQQKVTVSEAGANVIAVLPTVANKKAEDK
jgi:hypothetical protein